MTTAEAVSTTGLVSGRNAVYYVVPVVAREGTNTQGVLYFNPVTNAAGKWQKVAANMLDAKGQKNCANEVTLVQPSASEINDLANLQPGQYDPTATLYAAVARTLGPSKGLPRAFAVAPDRTMTIPVAAGTIRGLVLVFSKTATADGEVPEFTVVTDPEIKNSTGDPETKNSIGSGNK